MNAIIRRLRKLEEHVAPKQDELDLTLAGAFRERRCRRLAQESGVPYEQALREDLVERQAFWADYVGDGTIADTLRYARRRRFELSASPEKTAWPSFPRAHAADNVR